MGIRIPTQRIPEVIKAQKIANQIGEPVSLFYLGPTRYGTAEYQEGDEDNKDFLEKFEPN